MKMKTYAFLLVAALCLSHAAAQPTSPVPAAVSLPQIIPATPEAGALIRNIQFPVNYSHGMVDISIPLYEIVVGDVTIPISLNYNHKGTRPLEYSQYLGQGWTLNAEPVITRKTNGKLDRDCAYTKYAINYAPNQTEKRMLADFHNSYDAFPDEYYYRVSGKSGAFIFKTATPSSTPSDNLVTVPYEPIKVGYNSGTSSPNDGSFTLIDDSGLEYLFDAVENTEIFRPDGIISDYYPTSWKCTRIITPKGNINFAYYPDGENTTSQVTNITNLTIFEDKAPGERQAKTTLYLPTCTATRKHRISTRPLSPSFPVRKE